MNYSLGQRYVKAHYGQASAEEVASLRADAMQELDAIKAAKAQIHAKTGVHGRFQQSQLDVLDIREMKVCGIIDGLGA
jgi:hypothetical protein